MSDFSTTVRYVNQRETDQGVVVEYQQDLKYVSTTEARPLDVIRQPFEDDDLSAIYVNQLKASGSPEFADLESVSPPESLEGDDDDDGGLSTGALVGIIVGAAAAVAIGIFLVMRSNRGGSHEQLNERDNSPPATFSALQSEEVSTMDDQGIGRAGTGETGSILDVGDQR